MLMKTALLVDEGFPYVPLARYQYTDTHTPYSPHYTDYTILTPILAAQYVHGPHYFASYRADMPTFQIPDTHVIQRTHTDTRANSKKWNNQPWTREKNLQ